MIYTDDDLTKVTTSGLVFNYASERQTNACVRRKIVFRDAIDHDRLETAMELTRKRYPQLSLALSRTDSGVAPVPNHKPFRLSPLVRKPYTMGLDTNGHLLAFHAGKTVLLVDYFHGIVDDAGMDRFLHTLLHTYLSLMGYSLDNSDGRISTVLEEFDPTEGEDPGAALLASGKMDRPEEQPKKAFKIKGRRRGIEEPDYAYVIRVDLPEALAYTKASGSSPSAVLSTLFSRVLYRHYLAGVMGKDPIVCEVAVNLRNFFPSNTMRNFVGNIYLGYDAEIDALSAPDACRQLAISLRAQNTEACQHAFHNHSLMLADKWFGEGGLPPYAKNWVHKHIAIRAMEGGMTYGLSNIGKEQLPSCLQPHIADYYSMIPSGLHAYLLSMRSLGDTLTMCVTSKLDDSAEVVREFVNLLVEEGIGARLDSNEDFYYTKYVQGQAVTPPYEPKVDLSPAMDAIMHRIEGAQTSSYERKFRKAQAQTAKARGQGRAPLPKTGSRAPHKAPEGERFHRTQSK